MTDSNLLLEFQELEEIIAISPIELRQERERVMQTDVNPKTGKPTAIALVAQNLEKSNSEISAISLEKVGTGTSGFLGNIRNYVVTYILDGEFQAGLGYKTYKDSMLTPLSKFLQRNKENFSPKNITYINELLSNIKNALKDTLQPVNSQINTELAFDPMTQPGVYVVTKAFYENRPVDEQNLNTLYKVGVTNDNMAKRLKSNHTYDAEPLTEKRLYIDPSQTILDYTPLEHKMQALMRASAQMDNPFFSKGKTGKEWFLTNLSFLDLLASYLGLEDSLKLEPDQG